MARVVRQRVQTAVAALVLVVAATACGSAEKAVSRAPSRVQYVELAAGRYRESPWALYAFKTFGQLCFKVARPGHPAESSRSLACTFKPGEADSNYWDGEMGPGRSTVIFGPLPEAAARIDIGPGITRPAVAFPTRGGLPDARYWYIFATPDQTHHLYERYRAYDEGGHRIPFQSFS